MAGSNFLNLGNIAPGSSPGKLTVNGDIDNELTSRLIIEIAGVDQGTTYDLLEVMGIFEVDGRLDVNLLGFTPDPLDVFTVVSAAASLARQLSTTSLADASVSAGVRFRSMSPAPPSC